MWLLLFACPCTRPLINSVSFGFSVRVVILYIVLLLACLWICISYSCFTPTKYSHDDIFYRSCLSGHSGHLLPLLLSLSFYLLVVRYLTTSVWIPGLGLLVWIRNYCIELVARWGMEILSGSKWKHSVDIY
jgi:hypothetical protein